MFRLLLFLMITIFLSACSGPEDIHETRFIMGTLVEFTIADADKERAEKAITAAALEMQRIEDTFTIYGTHPNSVKDFNNSGINTPVILPKEVSDLLRVALKIKQQSQGAFDPAIGGLNLLWGFSGSDTPSLPPAQSAIDQIKPPSTCIKETEGAWMRTDTRCLLDFGAIAKGYAIDRGIELFKQHGINSAIINAGGDIRLIGSHGDRPWRIGIRHPRNKGEVIETLELEGDVAVVTSGDYERFYIHEGNRYHHIINPATGHPATNSQSATIIADNATLADAWSTALFILGEDGMKLTNNLKYKSLTIDLKGRKAISD
ncbi:FAD:protein FMN transferase [Mariprofundus micogutta]|uniref:FAD:protein FMN transferase n=1 Tax=Mariprofundus micogutta TaxID=1921010 RepID=A0A1L8CM22_9PROT|nr:FAD:protein FMN transferase [Mariprofundus micogutta]GAV19899.1 FAD:protein FMN transferase [Mariprofundus micogutta]